MDISKQVQREKIRCAVGLHNYMFHHGAKSRDQAKELLICKRCGFLLVPSSLEPRKQYIHEEKDGN